MTDPERISNRSRGLAAELLRAGADEQPTDASVERTLLALGASSAVLTTTTAASATAASSIKAAGAASAGAGAGAAALATGTAKVATLTVLAKWVSIGVVGGVALAGAAAVATAPRTDVPAPRSSVVAAVSAVVPAPAAVESAAPAATQVLVEPPTSAAPPAPPAPPRAPAAEQPTPAVPELEVGAPLAAEVAYVDRARALVASGQTAQGLALLRSYERDFPEARLLPEVLFLQLETLDRSGRTSEARVAAQRLVDGFPKSPHASRARKLLTP
jgi:TolA-binding protein